MRVLLDTNVVVSAFIWGGTPHRLIAAAAAGDIELCSSPQLLSELREVIGRQHLASRLKSQHASVERILALYEEMVVLVSPGATPRVVPNDSDDDHVIAAAVAAGADYIVSGDRHLLSMVTHEGINIVGPAELVQRLGA